MSNRSAREVETQELCRLGCGKQAKFQNRKGLQCSPYPQQCEALKALYSESARLMHAEGRGRDLTSEERQLGLQKAHQAVRDNALQHRKEGFVNETLTLTQWRRYTQRDDSSLYHCSECGVGDLYNGKPLTLQLDHRDGNPANNVQQNFRWLCPNCHTQTPTWGKKSRL